MESFEEKFLEELAKARARLEGKEAYDDEAIEKEFIPDEAPMTNEHKIQKKTQNVKRAKPETVEKEHESEVMEKEIVKHEKSKKIIKSKENKTGSEKLSVVVGAVSLVLSFVFSCLGLLIENDSPLWQAFDSYVPFIGMVLGAVSVIWGALLIKKNKKGAITLVLGVLAMFISVFVPAVNF